MQCGLLGRKLSHSYSPQIHAYLGDYAYSLFEVEPENIESFLKNTDFAGINVTIPYKKALIPYCQKLTDVAQRLGAVNTIIRNTEGLLVGHNTDYFGFLFMVQKSGLQLRGKKVLVLGSGGASNTAVAVMEQLGAQVTVISRTGENNYTNLQKHSDTSVIVNATPVGMYPNNGISPVDLGHFPSLEGVLDMVYNPARTRLLQDAEARGLVTLNGLWMLIAQAKEAAQWFAGRNIDDQFISSIYKSLHKKMQNIVLIGMPGCGKSTVGKILATQYNRIFIDADSEIEARSGCSIPKIFQSAGEKSFREIETAVLADLTKKSGCVIATGGGCVTKPENYPLLHQNGMIIWLQKDISTLPTEGRPLSQSAGLQDMYQIRKPLYQQFADFTVSNDGTVEETLEQIRRLL